MLGFGDVELRTMSWVAVGVGIALLILAHLYSRAESKSSFGKPLNRRQFSCAYTFVLVSIIASFFGMDIAFYVAWIALGVSMLTFFDSGALSKTQQTLDQLEKITGIRALPDLVAIVRELKSQFEAANAAESSVVSRVKLICSSPAIGKFAHAVLYAEFQAQMAGLADRLGDRFVVVCYDPKAPTDDEASLRKFARAVRYPEDKIEEFVSAADHALQGLESQSATVYKRVLTADALRVLSKDSDDPADPSIWFFHMCLIEYADNKRHMIMWHLERPKGEEDEVQFSCVGFSTSQPELISAFEASLNDRLAGYVHVGPILHDPDPAKGGSWWSRTKARWFPRSEVSPS